MTDEHIQVFEGSRVQANKMNGKEAKKHLMKRRRFIMKLSARNVLKGKVKGIVTGAVNSEVTLVLPGGTELVSIITNVSAKTLNLKKGKKVYAVVKASNIILGVD
jgi:molybdopterin-binding protein